MACLLFFTVYGVLCVLTSKVGDRPVEVGAIVLLVRQHLADLGDGNLLVLAILTQLAVSDRLGQHLCRSGRRLEDKRKMEGGGEKKN